jgi:hypothetical protein
VLRAAARGEAAELAARRRARGLAALSAAAFALALLSGGALMRLHGWSLGWPRWLALKVGLVLFLFLPLEGFLAYVAAFWSRPGLARTAAPPFARELERAASMQQMVWAVAAPLLALALPLVLWLSLARPF